MILGVLVLLAGLYLWRSGRTLASMVSILVGLLPWLGLTLVLSLGAAALAKAAESRRRSGRALSLLPFCFLGLIVLPLMVSQLLHRLTALPVPLDTQSNPVFTPAPILLPGMFWGIVLVTGLLVYLAWALWWRALLWALETRGEVDIWSIIAETQVPRQRESTFRQQQRFLRLKQEVLRQRELRQGGISQDLLPRSTEASPNKQETHPWAQGMDCLPLVLCLMLVLGVGGYRLFAGHAFPWSKSVSVPSPIVDAGKIVFWYQATSQEAEIIEQVIGEFNQAQRDLWVEGKNISNLNQVLLQAGMANALPDVLLGDTQAIEYTQAVAQGQDGKPIILPLWEEDALWRRDLQLIVLPKGTKTNGTFLDFAQFVAARIQAHS